ncbi:hypothetical protein CYLTODRAFT_418457 [Cylindrobasidium torrendii FP15055 ss-10]|uniref:Uncharacterized protein n=1 Tax=Cylindrobasidium torrendii FP15055 ss-10 TaxID=1314674 RepID=A0A0D7BNY4_9AGAR|nr:hypothetical protein CYLTODRAFT_418457 [Cylindrobasidium torrendii FP15055 ss-10]
MVAQIPIARCHRPQGQGPLSLEKIILEAIATMDDMEEWEWWLWRQYPSVIEDDRVSGMAGMVRLESERKEWMAMAEDVIRNMYEADMAWYLCKSCGMQYI